MWSLKIAITECSRRFPERKLDIFGLTCTASSDFLIFFWDSPVLHFSRQGLAYTIIPSLFLTCLSPLLQTSTPPDYLEPAHYLSRRSQLPRGATNARGKIEQGKKRRKKTQIPFSPSDHHPPSYIFCCPVYIDQQLCVWAMVEDQA